MESNKEKPSKLFAIRDYVVLALLIIGVALYSDVRSGMINYPVSLVRYTAVAIGILIIIVRFRKFEVKYMGLPTTTDRLFYVTVCLIVTAAAAWVMACMALMPFDYYNIHTARKNAADTVRCNIDSALAGYHSGDTNVPNKVYYHFQGKPNTISTEAETPLIANMYALHISSQYRLKLTVRRALLGSYLLEDWKIENKPSLLLQKAH